MPSTRPVRRFSALAAALTLLFAVTGCALLPLDADLPAVVHDEDLGDLTVYEVSESAELIPAASGVDAEVWDLFVRVVTPEYAGERILWYQVGDNPDSDFLAWVIESDEDPALWNFAVNLATAEDRDMLLLTLIHEYAHLLSMGPGQTDESAACEVAYDSQPCTEDGAYLAEYHARFWAGYGDDAPAYHDDEDQDAFFEAHEEDFVSAYAATNVGEDFAEVFTVFVAEPEPADPAASVVAEKLAFMWAQPEFVEIRDRLWAEFGDITWIEF